MTEYFDNIFITVELIKNDKVFFKYLLETEKCDYDSKNIGNDISTVYQKRNNIDKIFECIYRICKLNYSYKMSCTIKKIVTLLMKILYTWIT